MQDVNEDVKDESKQGTSAGMTIYRAAETSAKVYNKKPRTEQGGSPVADGIARFTEGAGDGAEVRVLIDTPEMNITYAWFKSGFPLPLHSHNSDCIYQVIGGSMRVGTESLGVGDGVFIPSGVPYTVSPGDEGVEFLEFRPTGKYDTQYRGNTQAYWDRIVDTLKQRQEGWAGEGRPSDFMPAN